MLANDWFTNDLDLHSIPIIQNLIANIYWMTNNVTKSLPAISIQVSSMPFLGLSSIPFDPRSLMIVMMASIVTGQLAPLLAAEIVEEREVCFN